MSTMFSVSNNSFNSFNSFNHFVIGCITRTIAKCEKFGIIDDTKFSSQVGIFEDIFHNFFSMIEEHEEKYRKYNSICLFNHLDNNPSKSVVNTKYDRMYSNFCSFLDYSLKNICVVNIQTLYDGLATQVKKFVTIANAMEYNSYVPYPCICQDPYGPSFNDVLYQLELTDYHMQEKHKYDSDIVVLKELNNKVRTQKVQGHRKDYEKHVYNKGLNKLKRDRSPQSDHKNKKSRDYSVV